MSNKSSGNKFERDLAERLYGDGFWVHVMQQNKAGQPADIIAVRNNYVTLIDCKEITGHTGFILHRVEENQRLAMSLFQERTGGHSDCWFALKLPDETIRMLSFDNARFAIAKGYKSISESTMDEWTLPYYRWLDLVRMVSSPPLKELAEERSKK